MTPFRFHIPGLPHTQTTKAYSWDAFSEKMRKFADQMTSLGHEVYLYGGEHNEAACVENVTVISEQEQEDFFGTNRVPVFGSELPEWKLFNERCIDAISTRYAATDFLCLTGGLAHKPISDAFPEMTACEQGVGYEGVFTRFRIFESYAWMHTIYGATMGAGAADGNFYDDVIPGSFEVEDFPMGAGEGGYLLYLGRLTARKGLQVVADVIKRTGLDLVVAGVGDAEHLLPATADFRGTVFAKERAELMGHARALICPTIYVEPFGCVAAEAQMCGTPVITVPWGGFTETVEGGKTGFHCHTLADFCRAAEQAESLDRSYIRERAVELYSTDTVKYQYEDYFRRLAGLRGEGWYA